MKKIILGVLLIVVIGFLSYKLFFKKEDENVQESDNTAVLPENQENNDLLIETLKEGTGDGAKNGDVVTVHYVGTLENGQKFDSSLDREIPFSFTLGVGQVIRGWDLGVLGMEVGEKRKLTIPSELGYGISGFPPVIPPEAILIFEVEMLGINQQ